MQRLQATGVYKHWLDAAKDKRTAKAYLQMLAERKKRKRASKGERLGLRQLGVTFLVLAVGLGMSGVAFLVERKRKTNTAEDSGSYDLNEGKREAPDSIF